MRNSLLLLSLFSLPLLGQLRAPERLGSLTLVNMPNGFAVLKENKIHSIESDAVDSTLRKMDYKQRAAYMLKGGGLELNQAYTGEYTLQSVANLKGGGVILAKAAYWAAKSLCWGAVGATAAAGAAAVVTTVAVTGGAAAGAVSAVAGTAIVSSAPVAATLGATIAAPGAAMVATAIGGATAAGAATGAGAAIAAGTTAVSGALVATAASTTGAAGLVLTIEAVSLAAAAGGAAIWWLP